MKYKKISKRSFIFALILILLTIINSAILCISIQLFPSYGGYSRQILFIKPEQGEDSGGYFIIIDKLAPKSRVYDIDWLLHSRGDLNLSEGLQSLIYTVPSYTTNDNISLKVSFLEEIEGISDREGIFCPVNYREGGNYEDVLASYIKASYSGSETPVMATLLYPKNDTDLSQQFKEVISDSSGLKKIGNYDYLYYDYSKEVIQFLTPDIQFEGELFFMQQNKTTTSMLEFYYLKSSKSFQFESSVNFSSLREVNNILVSYLNSSQISGYIDTTSNQISISIPFIPEMVKLNGINNSFTYHNSIISFEVSTPCSFVISPNDKYYNTADNTLRISAPTLIKPGFNEYSFDPDLFVGLTHPYILFNSSELPNLSLKINDTLKPWNSWYDLYLSSHPTIEDIIAQDISIYEQDQRHRNVYKLALKFAVENNASCLSKLKDYLFDMETITHYSQDLRRAHNVQAYAIAFDIVYNNLTGSEQSLISNLLYEHAKPLMRMDLYHRNNHRVVDAGALGLAGLALQDLDMIDLATETALDYYYNQNPADGGSFEGYSYMAYAMMEMMLFASGLKKLGAFDFFSDPKFILSLDYTAQTLGPIGMPGSFEDCTFDPEIQETLLISAAKVNSSDPSRAQHYQYIWEQRQNNQYFPGAVKYGYIKGDNPSFQRILCYNVNDSLIADPYTTRKEIWKESSMAFLRHGDHNGYFMPFSCKNYDQNHPHQDENSFELWAFGAYLVNNPGYPGWGKPYHTWSQSTEGSNSLLIGGSEQLQVIADGLSSSISSTYFSMVQGDANEIHNDLGSFQYVPEYYVFLISIYFMIGLIGLFFLLNLKQSQNERIKISNKSTFLERFRPKNYHQNQFQDITLSKLTLIKLLFSHPFKLINYLFYRDEDGKKAKLVNRMTYTVFLTITGMTFLISSIDVNNTVIYHSQYHEDKYNLVFDILPIIIIGIFTVGTAIILLLTYSLIKLYRGTNRLLVNKILERRNFNIDKKRIKSVSTISFAWLFPMILFGGILIYLTTTQSLKFAIHGLWTELNSINDVYDLLVSVLIGLMINFGIIVAVGIPFIVLATALFTYGITLYTNNQVKANHAWKISISSLFMVSIVVFMIFFSFYIFFKSIFSLITIEAIVG